MIRKQGESRLQPVRNERHAALDVFLGDWVAEGLSFGGPGQDPDKPRDNPTPWKSRHTAYWHTGRFFLVQDERARVGGEFDTLSIMGWDDTAACHFAQTFENHGFYRHYDVTVDGKVWVLSGATERARITFSDDGTRQTICWEWKPQDRWLPLCDRVATRT